jgi:hypothetical protein
MLRTIMDCLAFFMSIPLQNCFALCQHLVILLQMMVAPSGVSRDYETHAARRSTE